MLMFKRLLVAATFLSLPFFARAQCKIAHEIKAEPASDNILGKIQISLLDFSGKADIRLYDIMDQRVPLIAEKKNVAVNGAKTTFLFDGLKPTTYIIQVSWGGCKQTLGGLEGIKIDQTGK
jgi:hypothetical protein